MHLRASLAASSPKREEKLLPILLIQENKLAPITAAHQVIANPLHIECAMVEPLIVSSDFCVGFLCVVFFV